MPFGRDQIKLIRRGQAEDAAGLQNTFCLQEQGLRVNHMLNNVRCQDEIEGLVLEGKVLTESAHQNHAVGKAEKTSL
jgi:hypothetical protein